MYIYLLMENLGNVVESVGAKTSNANAITMNTFGWCLLSILDHSQIRLAWLTSYATFASQPAMSIV